MRSCAAITRSSKGSYSFFPPLTCWSTYSSTSATRSSTRASATDDRRTNRSRRSRRSVRAQTRRSGHDPPPPDDRHRRDTAWSDGIDGDFCPLSRHRRPAALSPIRRLRWPSAQYWFGTDMLGRDVYSRTVYGARVSLIVGISVALLATTCGLAIGVIAGFTRWVDAIVMRIMDGLMSIPSVL